MTEPSASPSVVLDKAYNAGTRYGILLVCEGAPESLGMWHLWRFLEAQLSNPRLIDRVPMWLWKPLLYATVLPRRIRQARAAYNNNWILPSLHVSPCLSASPALTDKAEHRDGVAAAESSPAAPRGVAASILTASLLARRLELSLQERLRMSAEGTPTPFDVSVQVEVGFYHSGASIASALQRLRLHGNYGSDAHDTAGDPIRTHTEHLLVLPLYPHYTSVRSATVWDAVMQCGYFQQQRNIPNVHFIRSYSQHTAYLAAWHRHIRRFIGEHGKPDWLVIVFEGVPAHLTEFGDTCRLEYTRTTERLRELLSVPLASTTSTVAGEAGDHIFADALDPSRVVPGYTGDTGDPPMEPRVEKVLLSILKQLRQIVALHSKPSSVVNRESAVAEPQPNNESVSVPSSSSSRSLLPHALMQTAYVVCPGIAVDGVETLWAIENRLCAKFKRLGWREVRYIPALNSSPAHGEMLADVLAAHIR